MIPPPIIAAKMTSRPTRYAAITLGALMINLGGCTNPPSVAESDYATRIVGGWQGVAGGLNESMVFNGNGTFVCRLQKTGFIAEMLYPAPPGTVTGSWAIAGATMTLTINGTKNEHLTNDAASSEIVAFHENDIVLRSHGSTSSFRRTTGL